ncbi:MAG TPA: hypothetical protein VM779_10320 [Thermoanaerobaculia bacterium]|nr:hypothetical protein [Thermoanaerobaculia bacterium]
MSRGFLCALSGIALTIFSWYGPWGWPAWPAFAVLHLVFGTGGGYHELPPAGRGAVIVALLVINVTAWAIACYGLWAALRRLLHRGGWYEPRRRT